MFKKDENNYKCYKGIVSPKKENVNTKNKIKVHNKGMRKLLKRLKNSFSE